MLARKPIVCLLAIWCSRMRAAEVVVRLATSAFYLPEMFRTYPPPFLRSLEMKLHVVLPAALAIGMVSFIGTQADAFELLDGLLSSSSYDGSDEHVSCDGKGFFASTCAPACCDQKGCGPRPLFCWEPIYVPRLYLLDKAGCRIRVAAEDLHCKAKALHCKTQALCDAIKVRLFCPRCCKTTCGCAPTCSPEPSCMQKGLEVQK
jgi:hypothetical protein